MYVTMEKQRVSATHVIGIHGTAHSVVSLVCLRALMLTSVTSVPSLIFDYMVGMHRPDCRSDESNTLTNGGL